MDRFKSRLIALWAVALALLAGSLLVMWAIPRYVVYCQRKAGEAELARAESNRKIKVEEARAEMDAANMLAEAKKQQAEALSAAEIIRARGVAEANKIIGASLHDNEAYLRYLWVSGLQTNNMQVIYVPTEGGLPILEAGKAPAR